MKIVLDTNVTISAMLWKGSTAEIFALAERGEIELCVTDKIIKELKRVLEYPKFARQLAAINMTPKRIASEFLQIATRYPDIRHHPVLVQDDPSDDKFLLCADAVRAKYIISGDRHLLRLKVFRTIPILTPAQFLKRRK